MTAVAAHPPYADAYNSRGYGGLMGEAFKPLHGFGKFLLCLIALSTVGCNLINTYGIAFAVQNFHPVLLKLPRIIITALGSAAIIAIAIAGENSFESVLESFLDIIG